MAVPNALSERLALSTMHSRRYWVVFSKGMIASLLHRAHCDCPQGTTSLTTGLIAADEALTPDDLYWLSERVWLNLHSIAERFGLNTEGVWWTTAGRGRIGS